jgi:hypothetical protein
MVENILNEISSLENNEKKEIYDYLRDKIITSKSIHLAIQKYKGIVSNLWGEDAQSYIQELRSNDRI